MLGVIVFLLMSSFAYRWLWDGVYFLYGFIILLLSLVFALGIVRLGAQRWLKFGGMNFQPSELAKVVVIILLARYFSKKSLGDISLAPSRLGLLRAVILPFAFVAVPMALIIEQPDLGSALLLLFIFIAMLFLANIRMSHVLIICSGIILAVPVFWRFLRGYQKERLLVFLNPNIDPLGAGYTLIQSKIAIGSGGFFGKGWLSGTQSQLRFLPESHTDFIFAALAEEWGLLGCVILLFLFYLLIREGLLIASRTTNSFGRLLACGISVMLGIQSVVNIAMTMGLMPVVGVPLPLMSYGGSSIVVTFAALGILANINRSRSAF
jgi:rod shape determining protein RodA